MTTQSLNPGSNVMQPSHGAPVTSDEIMRMISGWMKERNYPELSDPNMTFADAGFDSLASVELAFFFQDELGVELDETVLFDHPTFAALASYLIERLQAK